MHIHQLPDWLPVVFQPPKKADKARPAKTANRDEEPKATDRLPPFEFDDDDSAHAKTDILA